MAANKPGEKKMMPYSSLQPTMTSSNRHVHKVEMYMSMIGENNCSN